MIKIGRAINGISLNGNEWLLDKDNKVQFFKDKENAIKHLKETDFPDFTEEDFEDNFTFKKMFLLTKDRFLEWLIGDTEDHEYWGNRFIKDLKRDHEIAIVTEQLFEERESIPGHLFEDQFTEEDLDNFMEDEDIPINMIELVMDKEYYTTNTIQYET